MGISQDYKQKVYKEGDKLVVKVFSEKDFRLYETHLEESEDCADGARISLDVQEKLLQDAGKTEKTKSVIEMCDDQSLKLRINHTTDCGPLDLNIRIPPTIMQAPRKLEPEYDLSWLSQGTIEITNDRRRANWIRESEGAGRGRGFPCVRVTAGPKGSPVKVHFKFFGNTLNGKTVNVWVGLVDQWCRPHTFPGYGPHGWMWNQNGGSYHDDKKYKDLVRMNPSCTCFTWDPSTKTVTLFNGNERAEHHDPNFPENAMVAFSWSRGSVELLDY